MVLQSLPCAETRAIVDETLQELRVIAVDQEDEYLAWKLYLWQVTVTGRESAR